MSTDLSAMYPGESDPPVPDEPDDFDTDDDMPTGDDNMNAPDSGDDNG